MQNNTDKLCLFGAGTTGRVIARNYRDRILCFADNDKSKWQISMEGINVQMPLTCKHEFPDATWICSVIHPPQRKEILAQLVEMKVKTAEVWDYLPKRHELPSQSVMDELTVELAADDETTTELYDQFRFRQCHDTCKQRPHSDISEIYFPDFITRLDNEHYVDCGAADGDTVREFLKRWKKWDQITAYEPDSANFAALYNTIDDMSNVYGRLAAVGDEARRRCFVATGDYSAHLGSGESIVECTRLDDENFNVPPTYIKMDIEGSEPAALWGARRILKEHKPVLAICAYHESEHLWTLPLLVHALQPEYRAYLRRYAEGSFELVWYFVPPERVKA